MEHSSRASGRVDDPRRRLARGGLLARPGDTAVPSRYDCADAVGAKAGGSSTEGHVRCDYLNRRLLCAALILPLICVLWCESVAFHVSAAICPTPALEDRVAQETAVTALLVADVHVLGNRRSRLDRVWTDWQLRKSFDAIVAWHKIDVVVNVGDYLDEGYRSSDKRWTEYADRYHTALRSASKLHSVGVVGNHDTELGYAQAMGAVDRFERTFLPANYFKTIEGTNITFVGINSMALDGPQLESEPRSRAKRTLADFAGRRRSLPGPVILLSHLPMFRKNDMDCGARRIAEAGHVTYVAPSAPLAEHTDVLSEAATKHLLRAVHPTIVFSGHLHAECFTSHSVVPTREGVALPNKPIPEVTLPTFSWRMRPDPGFAIAAISNDPSVTPAVVTCGLPNEHVIFATYALLGVVEVVAAVLLVVRARGCAPGRAATNDDKSA